ncbi:MAG: phage Gp37/Gp68 family protein [Chloroflexota bacterium]|nr:phage Gp37/Gp68 family protein [Chloroflexota bacterium]
MADTTIEWASKVWNPTLGCTRVSEGCTHCYAMHFARRFDKPGRAFEGLTKSTSHGTDWSGKIRLRPEKLREPFSWKQPERVFVDSMSDLFHHKVDEKFIAKVFAIMALAPQHSFQVLTKRPDRMRDLLADEDFQFHVGWFESAAQREFGLSGGPTPWPLPNLWLGVSVEDQAAADKRIPDLLETPAAIRFLSCEPLLGPVDLSPWLDTVCGHPCPEYLNGEDCACTVGSLPRLDWVIVGGESGAKARPMHPDWARALRDQCQEAGVAYFFKQWGAHAPMNGGSRPPIYLDGKRIRDDADTTMLRVGKHEAGRLLDGRTWDEMPVVREVARV